MSPATDGDYALSAYLRRIIEPDRELRPTTRELYLRGVRTHTDPYPIAKADVRDIDVRHWALGAGLEEGVLSTNEALTIAANVWAAVDE